MKEKRPRKYYCKGCGTEIPQENLENFRSFCAECWKFNSNDPLDSATPQDHSLEMGVHLKLGLTSFIIALVATVLWVVWLITVLNNTVWFMILILIPNIIALILAYMVKQNKEQMDLNKIHLDKIQKMKLRKDSVFAVIARVSSWVSIIFALLILVFVGIFWNTNWYGVY